MKTGFYYSLFRLFPFFIPVYKVWKIVYYSYFFNSKEYKSANGSTYILVPMFNVVPLKKELYTKKMGHNGEYRWVYTGGFFQFCILTLGYFNYKIGVIFKSKNLYLPYANPFDMLFIDDWNCLLFRGIIGIGKNKLCISTRVRLMGMGCTPKNENPPSDSLFYFLNKNNTASSFIRTAGERVTAGARLILGLRVRAAAGMALTSFLPAAVPFFNQTQFVQKAATAVLLGGSSWPFCRLGLFDPFTSPVGGLFSFNRNTL